MEEFDKNSDEHKTSKGNALRFNTGKLRYDLVEPRAHRDFVQVLTDGANKYFDRNWEAGLSWTSVIASLKRHLNAIELGEDYDAETGRLHIAHLACNAHFLNAFYYTFPQGDDRPKRFLNNLKIGLDIDGVLADFMGAWHELYPEVEAEPTSWYSDREIMKRFDNMISNQTLDNFYLGIKPLISANDIPFEPHCYITSRPVDNNITEKWLDEHGFPRKPVHTVRLRQSKVDVAKENELDIFIDDSYENFVDLNNNGVFTYLYTAPWNVKYDVGHMRIDDFSNIPVIK